MPREGKTNPRLKGALTKDEFLEQYSKFIKGFYYTYGNFNSIDELYNGYLETYKYGSKEEVNKWLERKN